MKSLLAVPVLVMAMLLAGCPAAPPTFSQTKQDGGHTSNGALDLSGIGAGSCKAAEPCCEGQTCETAGLTCSAKGVCCGGGGYACTDGKECCAGFACASDTHLCCVGISSACQTQSECCSGLSCVDGICDKTASGGGAGDPCSASTDCSSGFECSQAGTCAACGTNGHACCVTQAACNPGLSCGSNKLCATACGATGAGCCPGNKCNVATDSCTNGKCTGSGTPGTLNNPCNIGSKCNTGLNCVGGTCLAPSSCNTVNAMCCAGNACTGGLQCAENGTCQTPKTCTPLEGDCTTSATCCTGYTCSLTVEPAGTPNKNTCCVGAGTACPDGDFDCCGYLRCVNTKCTANADGDYCLSNSDCARADCDAATGVCGGGALQCGTLTPIGGTCNSDSECCDGVCRALASTGNDTCCEGASVMCTSSKDCCGRMVCGSNGKCTPRQPGQSCLDSVECTVDHNCVNGTCASSSVSGLGGSCNVVTDCVSPGNGTDCENGACCSTSALDPCVNDSYCCSDYSLTCNFVTGFGNVCCEKSGNSCSTSSDCCSLSCNSNGFCD